jgi:hypothetical protein
MLIFELVKLNFENLTFNLEVVFRAAFIINHKQKKYLIFENYRKKSKTESTGNL